MALAPDRVCIDSFKRSLKRPTRMPFRAQTDFAYRLTAKPGRGDLTAIDLFSGAGGLTLGLLNAGFDVRLSSDIDAGCELTHRVNLPRIPFIAADLNKLSGLDILREAGLRRGELDLLAGGPPCQGFSIIGERDHTDTRNQLFSHFINMVDQIRPRAVLIENVPGLATLNKGMMLGHISRLFRKAGYRATCAEILSAQYGVPQMRWRMAFIAWREDTEIAHAGFPRPTHGTAAIGDLFPNRTLTDEETGGFLTAADAISDLPPIGSGEEGSIYTGKPASPYQQAMRAGLTTELFNHYAPRLNEANLRRLEHLKEGQDWRDLPRHLLPESMKRALRKDHTRRYSRMCWDATPRAIITRFRDPKSGEYTHPNQHRTISIREAARIQSFPDWFQFMGAHTDQYNQVGNAVPPLMGRAIGTEIARCLRDKKVRVHTAPKSRYVLPEGEQLKLQFAL